MPQYYTGYNPETAFSQGMMTGFSFVENIKQRRRQIELEERELARRDSNDKFNRDMAIRQDERAGESHDVAMQDSKLRLEKLPTILQQQVRSGELSIEDAEHAQSRRPVLEEQQDKAFATQQTLAGEQIGSLRENRQLARDQRQTLGNIAEMELQRGLEQPSVGEAAPSALNTTAASAQPVAAPASASTSEKASSPPARTSGGRGSPNTYSPAPFVKPGTPNVTEPEKPSASRTSGGRGSSNIFTAPTARAFVRDAGVTKPVKASDSRVTDIAQTAVTQSVGAPPSIATPEQNRLMNTQLARMAGKTKLTPEEVATISRAASLGVISLDQVRNYQQYGTAFAPIAPVFKSMGAGGGVMVYPNGYQIIPPGGKNGTKTAQTIAGGLKRTDNYFAALVQSESLDGDPDKPALAASKHTTDMIRLVAANASAVEQSLHFSVVDQNGELDMSVFADPVKSAALADFYLKTIRGNRDPRETEMPIENSDRAAESLPAAQPIDLTHMFQ